MIYVDVYGSLKQYRYILNKVAANDVPVVLPLDTTIQCYEISCSTYRASFGVLQLIMHVLWVDVVTVTNHDIIIITV